MYHPDEKYQLARIHQAEILKEAQAYRLSKSAEASLPPRFKRGLAIALSLATVVIAMKLMVG